ncbi:MAG: type III-B CRISPR module-associated Cmr3 family protein, partial [Coleofasciculus sp. C2-GNP5-27]
QQDGDEKNFRQYLPYSVVQGYLETGRIKPEDWIQEYPGEDKPWTIETRPHNAMEEGTRQVKEADGYFVENAIRLQPGWSLAIGVNQEIETPVTLRLGGEGHRVILQRCELGEQWHSLQQQSNQNYRQGGRSLAYLVTPGVFERIHDGGKAMCRAYPWEWKLAHRVNPTQQLGQFV